MRDCVALARTSHQFRSEVLTICRASPFPIQRTLPPFLSAAIIMLGDFGKERLKVRQPRNNGEVLVK
jgi:hypothetical protein